LSEAAQGSPRHTTIASSWATRIRRSTAGTARCRAGFGTARRAACGDHADRGREPI